MSAPCPLLTPNVEFLLALLEKTRGRMLAVAADLPKEKLLHVPQGFHNNILWNLGHVVVVQQFLCYHNSGQSMRIPAYHIPLFRKGSNPSQWTGQVDADEVKTWARETLRILREDLEQNRFGEFTPYETSMGLKLAHLTDVLAYVTWHEGLHLGTVMAIRKLI